MSISLYKERKIMKQILFIALFVFSQLVFAQTPPKSEWIDPLHRKIETFQEYTARIDFGKALEMETVYKTEVKRNGKDQLAKVIVNNYLYPQIEDNLNIYVLDLENEGYTVELEIFISGTAEDIRAELIYSYNNFNLQGVVFIGNLPLAWYEETGYISWQFPIDLFFMDMDGYWYDYNGNGIYDYHGEEIKPEIWVGRINTSRLTWDDEASLINNYFTKNHNYRIGNLSLPFRALGFFDDGLGGSTQNMDLIYPVVDIITNYNTTTADNYKYYLQSGYYHIHLSAHSSPWGSTFKINNGQPGGGTFFNYDVYSTIPQAFFYTFVCCMHNRFIELNNIGNWYLYSSDYGLSALGSTKVTYGVEYNEYYYALANGSSIGEALVNFLNQNDYSYGLKGLTILGDPTLIIQENVYTEQNTPENIPQPLDNYQIQISQVTTHCMTDGHPVSTVDGNGNLWLLWDSGRYVRSDQYVCYYDGNSWSNPETVGFDEYWDLHPDVIYNGNNIWAVWQSFRQYHYDDVCNFDIMAACDNDWTQAINISDPDWQNICYEVEPRLAVDNNGNIFVVWKRETAEGGAIYFSKYENSQWSNGEEIVSNMGMINDPILVFNDNCAHLFFESDMAGYKNIYHSIYSNNVWSTPQMVTDNDCNALEPEAVVDNQGTVWVFYRANINSHTEIYCRSYNGNWSDEIQVTNNTEIDVSPAVCKTDDGKIWIAWARKNNFVKYDIYLRILDNGQFTDETIISTDTENDMCPDICAYQNGTAIFWQSDRNNNWNIYLALVTYESDVDDMHFANICILKQNYPNPFSASVKGGYPESKIQYSIPLDNKVELKIYNIKGQLVRTIVDEKQVRGNHTVIWNSKDDNNNPVSSGIYFYTLKVRDKLVDTKKCLLLE